jgi:Peroxiredoxin
MNLKIGMKAPNFSLKNDEGLERNLKKYKGNKLIIFFYPKDNTPGCTKESCKFRDINKELNDYNCYVIGVSADNKDSHQDFIKNFNLNFELLSDENYEMSKNYNTFFISEQFGNSIKRSTFLLDENGIIINIWEEVKDPENHPVNVLNFLKNK